MSPLPVLAVAASLLAAQPAVPSPPERAVASGGLRVTLRGAGHTPTAGRPWRFTVTARTAAGDPVRATGRLEFLFHGVVVGRRKVRRFRGTWRDHLVWPAQAVGHDLVLRALVDAGRAAGHADYAIRVRR